MNVCDENGVVGLVRASTDGVPVAHVGVDVAGESLDESHLRSLHDLVVRRPLKSFLLPGEWPFSRVLRSAARNRLQQIDPTMWYSPFGYMLIIPPLNNPQNTSRSSPARHTSAAQF